MSDRVARVKIGILGGTFDPVHNAHLMIARQAMDAAALDRVVFMPAGTPPHKEARALTNPAHRLNMAKLAVQGIDGFEVSDIEIVSPGIDYTVDTLRILSGLWPDARLHFIIGGDSLMLLDKWRDPGLLLKLAAFVAVYRPGFALHELEQKRQNILAVFGGEILLVGCAGQDISSTEIRRRVSAGLEIGGLVPPAVKDYILANKLYREGV